MKLMTMASTHPYYQVFYTAVIWVIMQRSSTSGEERYIMIKLTTVQGTILVRICKKIFVFSLVLKPWLTSGGGGLPPKNGVAYL